MLYEVFSPFFVYLFAEWLGTSGILAVVAAGLIMADRSQRLTSASIAQRQLVSRSFWRIIVFLINSVVFVLLGMQLPRAMRASWSDPYISNTVLIGIILLVTLVVIALDSSGLRPCCALREIQSPASAANDTRTLALGRSDEPLAAPREPSRCH